MDVRIKAVRGEEIKGIDRRCKIVFNLWILLEGTNCASTNKSWSCISSSKAMWSARGWRQRSSHLTLNLAWKLPSTAVVTSCEERWPFSGLSKTSSGSEKSPVLELCPRRLWGWTRRCSRTVRFGRAEYHKRIRFSRLDWNKKTRRGHRLRQVYEQNQRESVKLELCGPSNNRRCQTYLFNSSL